MQSVFKLTIAVLLFLCIGIGGLEGWEDEFDETNCPGRGRAGHGYWRVDYHHGGPRCILDCYRGYQPSGCHVLRPIGKEWTFEVPKCEKEPFVSGRTLMTAGAGILSVVAAPFVLPVLGFGAAGVTAGSIAAAVQGSATAAGGTFAALQSAGAAGMAIGTKAAIGGAVSAATHAATSGGSGECEME